ncbi:MAG TPA: hypothetical protein VGD26_04460 [Chitinophagaceae bacterium]
MKKTITALLFLLYSITLYSQQLTQEQYLQKSKNQKTWGYVLTVGGSAMVIGGALAVGSKAAYWDSEALGYPLMAGGAAAIVGGISLLNSSKKNEQRAKSLAMTLYLKVEPVQSYQDMHIINNYYPALMLRIERK